MNKRFFLFVCFSTQGFSLTLEPVLELALADQAGLELTEIYLTLPRVLGLKACATTTQRLRFYRKEKLFKIVQIAVFGLVS